MISTLAGHYHCLCSAETKQATVVLQPLDSKRKKKTFWKPSFQSDQPLTSPQDLVKFVTQVPESPGLC